MRRAAARRGYDLGHRARQIREEDFDRFDMIVVMDDMNYENVHRLAPSRRAAEKIFRMREFFRRHSRWDHVPDPYYEGAEGFELVLDSCPGATAAGEFSNTSKIRSDMLQKSNPETSRPRIVVFAAACRSRRYGDRASEVESETDAVGIVQQRLLLGDQVGEVETQVQDPDARADRTVGRGKQ